MRFTAKQLSLVLSEFVGAPAEYAVDDGLGLVCLICVEIVALNQDWTVVSHGDESFKKNAVSAKSPEKLLHALEPTR